MSELSVVTSDKLFLDHEFERIDEEGILSQKLFGPIKAWKCACGTLNSKLLHNNCRCEKCKVLCADPDLRYKTYAKLRLPFPIYKNSESSKRKLLSLVGVHKNILDPQQMDRNITQQFFIELKIPNSSKLDFYPKLVNKYKKDHCIPIKITGTYSLYLALYAGAVIYKNTICKDLIDTCFSYELLVTPPKSRDINIQIKGGKRQIIVSSINDHYCKLLKTSNFDWPSIMDPQQMRDDFIESIREFIDNTDENKEEYLSKYQIQNNDELICRYQYYVNKIYVEIISSLSTKTGYIRKDFIGRSIDFSARAHIVPDPSLRGYEISLSKRIFIKLWFIEYLYFIKNILNKQHDYTKLLPYVEFTNMNVELDKIQFIDEFIEWTFSQKNYYDKLIFINRQPTLKKPRCCKTS